MFKISPSSISSTPLTITQPLIRIVTPGSRHQKLSFEDNAFAAVLARQVADQPVDGFPGGLPVLTPLGVRLTLESMTGSE